MFNHQTWTTGCSGPWSSFCVDLLKAKYSEHTQHELATVFMVSYIIPSTVMIKSRRKCYLPRTYGEQGILSIFGLGFIFSNTVCWTLTSRLQRAASRFSCRYLIAIFIPLFPDQPLPLVLIKVLNPCLCHVHLVLWCIANSPFFCLKMYPVDDRRIYKGALNQFKAVVRWNWLLGKEYNKDHRIRLWVMDEKGHQQNGLCWFDAY